MEFRTTVNRTEVVIDLPGISKAVFDEVGKFYNQALSRPTAKNRDVIRDAFLAALQRSPEANASDLWHHIIYRRYCEIFPLHRHQDPNQSWKRAGGEALEFAVQEIYSPILAPHGIEIKMLMKGKKLPALKAMQIETVVGSDKLDVALSIAETETIFGGVHVKAILAERISDDVPCSRAMMKNGFFSPMWTLDVKSFPPPGDLVNRGELGSTSIPSQKRSYIEIHGDFDNLYSGNARSAPSSTETPSGKRVIGISPAKQPDLFALDVLAAAKAFQMRAKK